MLSARVPDRRAPRARSSSRDVPGRLPSRAKWPADAAQPRELHSAPGRSRATRGQLADRPELPPELAQRVHAAIVQRIIGTLDQPRDMLKGKTLRQAARNAATRPDAIRWLREQQRILQLNPKMASLDMRPLWSELGLQYQGLETDR